MTIPEDLLQSSNFILEQNVYYQKSLKRNLEFEKSYITLRQKENRFYGDDVVKNLPEVPDDYPLKNEWHKRKKSLQKLLNYLGKKTGTKTILEVGCGNGWLSHHLAGIQGADVLGIDINETELLQGSALFKNTKNLTFAYADILQTTLVSKFDYIILASSIQYFSDVNTLIRRLFDLLKVDGEIHIIDTPIYKRSQVKPAQERSVQYFSEQGSDMHAFYFHHAWESFRSFRIKILYNPDSLLGWMKRKLSPDSPFPWVRIDK